MRKISTFLIGAFAFATVFAQENILPIDEKTGKVTYMEVVEAPGMNATETFQVMKAWATKHGYTVTSTDGTKADFNCSLKVSYPNARKNGTDDGVISFTANLMAKEGRYRYIFTDFMHTSSVCDGGDIKPMKSTCSETRMSTAGWARVRKMTNEKMKELVEELKKDIKEATNDPSKNDDW